MGYFEELGKVVGLVGGAVFAAPEVQAIGEALLPGAEFLTGLVAAPGKFEAKRFCSEKRVTVRCYVTYFCIFVVLSMKEPFHADPHTALSR